MKHEAEAFEFAFTREAFNLARENSEDGERIRAENDAQAKDRAQAEAAQAPIVFGDFPPSGDGDRDVDANDIQEEP